MAKEKTTLGVSKRFIVRLTPTDVFVLVVVQYSDRRIIDIKKYCKKKRRPSTCFEILPSLDSLYNGTFYPDFATQERHVKEKCENNG